MSNENGSIDSVAAASRAAFERDKRLASECAEEVHFRTGQFLRAYGDPFIDRSELVERARVCRDSFTGFVDFLTVLISEEGDKK